MLMRCCGLLPPAATARQPSQPPWLGRWQLLRTNPRGSSCASGWLRAHWILTRRPSARSSGRRSRLRALRARVAELEAIPVNTRAAIVELAQAVRSEQRDEGAAHGEEQQQAQKQKRRRQRRRRQQKGQQQEQMQQQQQQQEQEQ